jgi:hypothetical protein
MTPLEVHFPSVSQLGNTLSLELNSAHTVLWVYWADSQIPCSSCPVIARLLPGYLDRCSQCCHVSKTCLSHQPWNISIRCQKWLAEHFGEKLNLVFGSNHSKVLQFLMHLYSTFKLFYDLSEEILLNFKWTFSFTTLLNLPLSHLYQSQTRPVLSSHSLFLWKRNFCLFTITSQGVALWHFHYQFRFLDFYKPQ